MIDMQDKAIHRIVYIHIGDFPSQQVHTIQVMRMCEGMQKAGYEPVLFGRAPSPGEAIMIKQPSLFDHYGVENSFDVNLLHFPRFNSWPKAVRIISFFLFAVYALLQARKLQPDAIYTRDFYVAIIAAALQMPLIVEEHAPPLRGSHTWLRRRYYGSRYLRAVVFISQALKDIYKEMGLLSISRAPTVVAHDAAAYTQIRIPKLSLPTHPNKRIRVGYVGSVLPGRGIELILNVARRLPDLEFELIGGNPTEIEFWKNASPNNVVWRGFIPPGSLTPRFELLDILLMPYQENTVTHNGVFSARWMSPLKMFEYMASGVPLVASDLPVLREVLTTAHNCLLAPPDNVDAWVQAVTQLATDPAMRTRLAVNAQADVVQVHNWVSRVESIMQVAQQKENMSIGRAV